MIKAPDQNIIRNTDEKTSASSKSENVQVKEPNTMPTDIGQESAHQQSISSLHDDRIDGETGSLNTSQHDIEACVQDQEDFQESRPPRKSVQEPIDRGKDRKDGDPPQIAISATQRYLNSMISSTHIERSSDRTISSSPGNLAKS